MGWKITATAVLASALLLSGCGGNSEESDTYWPEDMGPPPEDTEVPPESTPSSVEETIPADRVARGTVEIEGETVDVEFAVLSVILANMRGECREVDMAPGSVVVVTRTTVTNNNAFEIPIVYTSPTFQDLSGAAVPVGANNEYADEVRPYIRKRDNDFYCALPQLDEYNDALLEDTWRNVGLAPGSSVSFTKAAIIPPERALETKTVHPFVENGQGEEALAINFE